MLRSLLAFSSLSLALTGGHERSGSEPPAEPECTADSCCKSCKWGYCADNTHHQPSGYKYNAQEQDSSWWSETEDMCGTPMTCDELTGTDRGEVHCTDPGYKDKPDKANIPGSEVDHCCDIKTCADLDCAAHMMADATDPKNPKKGEEPDKDDCCVEIVDQCQGNTKATDDHKCKTGYKLKDGTITLAADDDADDKCCEAKTCADLEGTCLAYAMNEKSGATLDDGKDPTTTLCCDATCASDNVKCGSGYKEVADFATTVPDTDDATTNCCERKLCADVVCGMYTMQAKSGAEEPEEGTEPGKECCEEITGQCSGNTDASNNVDCPSGFITLEGTYKAAEEDADALALDKYSSCCSQPKCAKAVAETAETCDHEKAANYILCGNDLKVPDWVAPFKTALTPGVQGTCTNQMVGQQWDAETGEISFAGFNLYADKSSIENLPAEPDWSEGKSTKAVDVSGGSNSEGCCDFRLTYCEYNTPGEGEDDFECPTGYKDQDGIRGQLDYGAQGDMSADEYKDQKIATCCVQKTCKDFSCDMKTKKAKSGAVDPEEGKEPTESDCCEDITGQCFGNTKSSDDVKCPSGFTLIEGKYDTGLDGDEETKDQYENCCIQPACIKNEPAVAASCSDEGNAGVTGTCDLSKGYSETFNLPAIDWLEAGLKGVDTSAHSNAEECCTPTKGKCYGNTETADDVVCPSTYVLVEGTYDTALTGDDLKKDQRKNCCKPPTCIANVAAVAGTCEGGYLDGVAGVLGTCDLSKYYTEDFNIPPQPEDWLDPPSYDVTPGSNIDACCKPRTLKCSRNTDSKEDYECPTGFIAQDSNWDTPYAADADDEAKTSACCNVETCKDFDCAGKSKKHKTDPTAPEANADPTEADCCEDIVNMCVGNTKTSDDVDCDKGGYHYKDMEVLMAESYAAKATDEEKYDACCIPKACADHDYKVCTDARMQKKGSPTEPEAGEDPTKTDCCEDIEMHCFGNTDTKEDVVCPAGYQLKPEGGTYAAKGEDMDNDAYDIVMWDACCQQPKCTANFAGVAVTCGDPIGQPAVTGSCNPLYFTEKANIATLPADPSGTDWNNDPIDVGPNSNPMDCCDHLPRCISDATAGVPFACPECQFAIDYHVNEVVINTCSNPLGGYEPETTVQKAGPICPQKVMSAAEEAAAKAEALKEKSAALEAEVAAAQKEVDDKKAAITAKEAEIAAMEEGDAKEAAKAELETMKADLAVKEKTLTDKQAELTAVQSELSTVLASVNGTNATNATTAAPGGPSKAASKTSSSFRLQVGIVSFIALALSFLSQA